MTEPNKEGAQPCFIDWNKLSLQEHIDYLKGRFAYSSEGTAKSVFELIAAYNALESRLQKANQYLEANGMEVRF